MMPEMLNGTWQADTATIPRRVTILVLEHQEVARQALRQILQAHGYKPIVAASVREAAQWAKKLGIGNIDLVISNVNLSADSDVQEGYALCRHWKAENPELPVVMISEDPRTRRLPAIRFGFVGFLLKPFSPGDVLNAVHVALGARDPMASSMERHGRYSQ